MKQNDDSQDKQDANKTYYYEPRQPSEDGIRAKERSERISADCPAQFQSIPIEACLNSATVYDPEVNYAIVLASVLLRIETRVAERKARKAQLKS